MHMTEVRTADTEFAGGAALGWRYPERMNAAAILVDEGVRRFPDEVAILFGDAATTYRELKDRVDRFGNALLAAGLARGERFVCKLRNTPEAAVALLAGMKIGAVPVPTFDFLQADELKRIVEAADAVAVIAHAGTLEQVRAATAGCSAVRFLVSVGPHESADYGFEQMLAASAPSLAAADTRKDDLAVLCFSSGTTGAPKGLPHIHQNVIAIADSSVPVGLGGLKPGDVVFSTSPFGFAFGFAVMIFCPLRYGAAAVYCERRIDARLACELLIKYRVTHFLTVPTLCAQMLEFGGAPAAFPDLRMVKTGGMLASVELQQRWRDRFGVEMLPAFGMQELIGSALSCFPTRFKRGTLGVPQPGCDARVLGEDRSVLGPGAPGRLALKTPFTIPYYWKDKKRTAECMMPGGWLLTDDIVFRDEEGFFHYVGRSDQTIISSGWTIGPAEIEQALLAHPGVAEAVVLGVADSLKGAIPVAAVVLHDSAMNRTQAEHLLNSHVRDRLAAYKCPREIHFFAELPKTRTGKMALATIREAVERRRAVRS